MKNKRAGGLYKVVEHLPSICKTLGSMCSTAKKKLEYC
jgi:hypothetical protein